MTKKHYFLMLPLIFSLFLIFGCSSNQFSSNTSVDTLIQNTAKKENTGISDINKQIYLNAEMTNDVGDYILGSGDLLEIKVFETDKLNSTIRINSRGFATIPLIGTLHLQGLSAREAEMLIEQELRKNVLHNAHVTIFIKEHVSQRITLVGSFKKPGTYDYISKKKLLDIIAMAEGLSDNAGTILYLTRQSEDNIKKTYMIDLDDLIKKGKMDLNITVLGGDVFFIPEAGFCYVDGAVRRPGAYPIKGLMKITEAIAAAGGLSTIANSEDIKLIRSTPDGKKDIVTISYSDIQQGKIDQVTIQDKDVVYVESSGTKTFFYGIGLNLGLPGLGFGYRAPPTNQ